MSKDGGIDEALEHAQATSFKDAKEFYHQLVTSSEASVDCLFIGNVSANTARDFFTQETAKMAALRTMEPEENDKKRVRTLPSKFKLQTFPLSYNK